ncbi:Uncharacterised protein [Vibrio cholerae]|nr:Uncharacterised protein [Vibrio cholerae]
MWLRQGRRLFLGQNDAQRTAQRLSSPPQELVANREGIEEIIAHRHFA